MKLLKTLITLLIVTLAFVACSKDEGGTTEPPVEELKKLIINEFMASNDSFPDEHGNAGDWIEIYNPNAEAVDIGGYYISDDPADVVAYEIPTSNPDSTTIPAKGFILLWADKMPEKGVLHVGIKLSGGGESVVLSKPDESLVDSYTYEAQETDISEGRETDGAEKWVKFSTPTPGASNN